MYHVYILRCADGTLYTGMTTDLPRRVVEHNTSSKGAKYTRARRPVTMVYSKRYRFQRTAARAEAAMKKLTRDKKLALLQSLTVDERAKSLRKAPPLSM